MPIYEPRKLSTQLCRLFDSGRMTVDEMAKLIGESPKLVEQMAKSEMMKIHPELRLRIGKVLAAYHKAFPETKPPSEYEFEQHRKLKLVTAINESIAREGTPRGVFKEDDAPAELFVLRSIDSTGTRRERRELLAADVTPSVALRVKKGMELYLDLVDPVIKSVESSDT